MKAMGYIPKFIQYAMLFNLKWKLVIDFSVTKNVLSENEVDEYLKLYFKAIGFLDDDVILSLNPTDYFGDEHKLFLLSKKCL